MISTFKRSDTEALFNGKQVARFVNIQVVALRKLAMLNRAEKLEDLRVPPNNRLEQLKCDRVGQWTVEIHPQGVIGQKDLVGLLVAAVLDGLEKIPEIGIPLGELSLILKN